MQKAVERTHRALREHEVPAKLLIQEKLWQIELADPKASELEEIICEENSESIDTLQSDIRRDATVRVRMASGSKRRFRRTTLAASSKGGAVPPKSSSK